ncbi:uncharacterized protein APUU_60759S [Aspergillus puulaauensis]|uniref:FAD-binding PCMH-type domain-containing protein n=1 Tax=Aspergillus puulaauensis TaxID=1220207 RepID=A0A7R7XUB7_9EURO|nr:uncharacterized protein APUU_60759S [Aspergillus puulaauensis]BCS27711.1 hypothetical protein APUU_60759S [Aspergillus puulaauensis]
MRVSLLGFGLFCILTVQALLTPDINEGAISCRCTPDLPCWPTDGDWEALNSTIDGNLLALKPLAYPCHSSHFNAAECTYIQSNAHNSSYRALQPGAMQYENWGSSPERDEQCYAASPQSVPCGQGRIPLFSAAVRTARDIQAAVKFAARHNVKLVIRNTGHDFLGRSTAPSFLQIFTGNMKGIELTDSFVPAVPAGTAPPRGVRAVTVDAGVQLGELYAYLGSKGVMVVGGFSSTVGMAGGYIQGGGHSAMGWLHGMASDNALEFQVVLADGSFVFANAYQNADLFFALRGGGGGSFGVVVRVTVNAYPDHPAIAVRTNYTLPASSTRFWDGVETVHNHLLELNDNGGTGYYMITPRSIPSVKSSTFELFIVFINQTDRSIPEKLIRPVISDLEKATGVTPSVNVFPFPTVSGMFSAVLPKNETTGIFSQLGSRLLSRSLLAKQDGPAQISSALSRLDLSPGEYIQGTVVAGGKVARNKHIRSGLNLAWREAAIHVLFTKRWDADTTFAQQAEITADITDNKVAILRSLEPDTMGAYVNEADANEVDFQKSFWGENYEDLYRIKKQRDPTGLFITRKGVGSEDWDDDGLCRI